MYDAWYVCWFYCSLYSETPPCDMRNIIRHVKTTKMSRMILIHWRNSIRNSAFQWCLSWLGLSWNDLSNNLTLTVRSVSSKALPVTCCNHVILSRDNWTSFLSDFKYEKVWKANTCKYYFQWTPRGISRRDIQPSAQWLKSLVQNLIVSQIVLMVWNRDIDTNRTNDILSSGWSVGKFSTKFFY